MPPGTRQVNRSIDLAPGEGVGYARVRRAESGGLAQPAMRLGDVGKLDAVRERVEYPSGLVPVVGIRPDDALRLAVAALGVGPPKCDVDVTAGEVNLAICADHSRTLRCTREADEISWARLGRWRPLSLAI